MAVTKVQNWDTGSSSVASGTSFSATNPLGAGNYVACYIIGFDSTGVGTGSVTSTFGGTWARVGTANQLGARTLEFWACTGVSGSNEAVTVTTQNGVAYTAACYEISGAGSYAAGSTPATATSTAPALTVSGFQTGALVLVGAKNGGSFSAPPGGSWNDYNANWLTDGNGAGLDDQIAPSTASLTATWTCSSQVWGTVGMYFNPGAPAPFWRRPDPFALRGPESFLRWAQPSWHVSSRAVSHYNFNIVDAITLSEGLARQAVASRLEAEALGLSESSTRALVGTRLISDLVGLSESLARQGVYARQPTETLSLVESLAHGRFYPSNVTDTIGVGDSPIRSFLGVRSLNDPLSLTEESPYGAGAYGGGSYGYGNAGIGRALVATRSTVDLLTLTESLSRGLVSLRGIGDTLTVAESLLRNAHYPRSLTEALALNEGLVRFNRLTHLVSDGVSLGESLVRQFVMVHQLTDALTISESLTRRFAIARTMPDTLALSEAVTHASAISRSLTDPLTFVEVLKRQLVDTRLLGDSVGLTESSARAFIGARRVLDTLALGESLVHSQTSARSVVDLLTLGESLVRHQAGARHVADLLTLGDAVTRGAAHTRNAADPLGLRDNITIRASIYHRNGVDTLGFSEFAYWRIPYLLALTDALGFSEGAYGYGAGPYSGGEYGYGSGSSLTRVVHFGRLAFDPLILTEELVWVTLDVYYMWPVQNREYAPTITK